ncbi:MAG: ATP synthase F1 subunit epsilon [Candidatus Onthovivens sp.]|nr:ATP synthase F1 subunit epsilon [Mollicutes bacterium]MDY3762142.1 ATP synthase F1 subunit epsilon [Candidatus Onthovivens sp.]MDY4822469.1 ATP synthase F1 subunit epsilon [Candidatus Onthovivens sp.]MDY5668040.1 ATP synthase F1 subunit epsilon [Candidatus Onthovivens sp.]MDY5983929.1 ATP synthase F1 subunit epsilon [Candidatus Onthovivens sp.]
MAYRSFEFEIISSDGKKQILSIELLCIKIPTYGKRTFLKGHIDYVATLDVSSFYVKEKDNGNNTYFAISGGILSVTKNKILILADTFETRDEIDKDRAINEKEKAELLLKDNDSDKVLIESAEFSLKKALNRLSIL